KTIEIEAVGSRGRAGGLGTLGIETWRAREDPQVVTVRRADNGPRVVVAQTDDPVVAPDGGNEGQPRRCEAHLQSRERSLVDYARDPSRFDDAIGGAA